METIKTDLHPNCTKFEVDLKSKVLIQYFEPEKVEFKRGDYVTIIHSKCGNNTRNNMIAILDDGKIKLGNNGLKPICCILLSDEIGLGDRLLGVEEYRASNECEINELNSRLLEKGYIFNKTTLELEKVHKFKQGDAVLVRDDDNYAWAARVFDSYSHDCSDYIYSTYLANWKQCIPFDPELVGTTNKPK